MKSDEKETGYLWPEMVRPERQQEATLVPEGYTEAFEKFWCAYPIRHDKRNAFKAFQKAIKRARLSDIMAGLDRYKSSLSADPKRPIKYAQGWLNGDRWLDEDGKNVGGTDDYSWRAHKRGQIGINKYQ